MPGRFQEEITTLKAHIDTLQEANQTLSASFMPDIHGCATYLVSGEGNIQAWSGGASDIYGYSVEEVLGRPLAFLQAQPDPFPEADPAGEQPRRSVRRRKDGSTFEVLLHHAVLRDENGGPSGRLLIEVPCG
ncbi:MAG TPA: PAS domain S-box protein, partial [Holophaga sp.]|nr:PAS domain S-box protein [Holophaga sp.]